MTVAGQTRRATEMCGGCGNSDPAQRCIGCLHDFAPASLMNTEQELRPCPLCQRNVEAVQTEADYEAHREWYIECLCGIEMHDRLLSSLITRWNRRSSDEQAEVVEFHVTDEKNGIDYTAHARSRAPAVAAGGVTEERIEAAARAISERLGFNPKPGLFIEHREMARAALSAALAVGDEGIREGVTGTGSVDVLRELAREEVALGYADHAKWLRYAANRLSSFDALRIAAALAGPTPPSRGEGV